MSRAVCPECRQGKHTNCDSAAWDNTTDQPVICDCWKINHETEIGATE